MPRGRCASCWRCSPRDWAFLAHTRLAGDYPQERAAGHAAALRAALADPAGAAEPALRGLAPDLRRLA